MLNRDLKQAFLNPSLKTYQISYLNYWADFVPKIGKKSKTILTPSKIILHFVLFSKNHNRVGKRYFKRLLNVL